MKTLTELAKDFLAQNSVAVIGISANKETVANAVYKKFKISSRKIFAIGKNTNVFNREKCYPSLTALPSSVDAVFISANKENTYSAVKECIALNIPRIWIHNSGGIITMPAEFLNDCKNKNITVIPGACPMMFIENADFFHKCMRGILSAVGKMKID